MLTFRISVSTSSFSRALAVSLQFILVTKFYSLNADLSLTIYNMNDQNLAF